MSPHSSYQSSLSHDKWNLICNAEVCVGLFFFSSAPAIYSRFLHISDERHRARLINKSLVCTKFYLFYSSCQESWIYWQKNVNFVNILLPTQNFASHFASSLFCSVTLHNLPVLWEPYIISASLLWASLHMLCSDHANKTKHWFVHAARA